MDLLEKKRKREEAKKFARGGQQIKESQLSRTPHVKTGTPNKEKKKAGYWIEIDLINRIKMAAIKHGGQPCHFVEDTMEDRLAFDFSMKQMSNAFGKYISGTRPGDEQWAPEDQEVYEYLQKDQTTKE